MSKRIDRQRQMLQAGRYDDTPRKRKRAALIARWGLLSVALLMMAVGVFSFYFAAFENTKFEADGEWPTTAGFVEETWIRRPNRSAVYYVHARYSYTVNGQRYETRLRVGPAGNPGPAQQRADALLGQTVTLWYDPYRPRFAQDNAVTRDYLVLATAAGGAAIVAGFVLLIGGQRLGRAA